MTVGVHQPGGATLDPAAGPPTQDGGSATVPAPQTGRQVQKESTIVTTNLRSKWNTLTVRQRALFLLLALALVAWGAVSIFAGASRGTVTVKAAPAGVLVTYDQQACTVVGAGTASAPVWDATNRLVTCSVTGFDDTSTLSIGVRITSNEPVKNVIFTRGAAMPSNACFTFLSYPADATPLNIPPGAIIVPRLDISGNASTINCAGTTPPQFSMSWSVERQP